MNVIQSGKRCGHPKEQANLLSKVTFFYNLRILRDTYKTGIFEEDQLSEVLCKCKAETSGDELQECLAKDIQEFGKPSLTRILWKCYGLKYVILGLIQLIVRSIVIISIPMTLSKVVFYFQPGQKDLSKIDAILFASLLILLNFLSVTYLHNYLLILSEIGIKVRTAFCSVIFRKCLKMSSMALSELGVGKIVTLMTKDVTAIENFIFYFNDTWIGLVQAVIVFYMIYSRMGYSTLVGMGFFIAVIPVQVLIGKLTSKLRLKSSKKTDERLQTTKETLAGIDVVKMNNWEDVFEKTINKSRKTEMKNILKIFLTKTSVLLIGSLTSKIAFYLLLTIYVLMGNSISAELVYYITTLFLRIRHALNVAIPVGLTAIADMSASLKRIEQLMSSKEVEERQTEEKAQKKPRISLVDVTVENGGSNILENVTLNVDSRLVIITGPVGSGKTTLLKTILGEWNLKGGIALKEGVVSYASQEPWIFPSTLKQNIIFEEDYDEERYQRILEICALDYDLQRIFAGGNVILGDKGANLSRGQKARINLARAVYKKADIYLLDDSLTSLDTHVQKHVFQKCIKEYLADKICIFVTQNLKFIETGDSIVIMDKGKIIFSHKLIDGGDMELQTFLKSEKKLKPLIEINNNLENDEEINISEETRFLKCESRKTDMYKEDKKSGKVETMVYQKYGEYGGGYFVITVIFIFLCGTQFSKSYTEKIISNWVNIVHQNSTKTEEAQMEEHLKNLSLEMYSIFTLSTIILSIISAFLLFNFSRKASMALHKYMLKSILNARMTFFDSHLLGNILNRFSNDLSIVDEQIPFAVYGLLDIFFGLFGMVILISTVNVLFLIPTTMIFIILYLIRKIYLPTGRNLQRLNATTRSPVVGYLNSSLEGLTTIRAFQAEKILKTEFDRHQDLYTSANYMSKSCERAFGYYLDICCSIYIGLIIGACIFIDTGISVGDVGLTITQVFTLTGIVQFGIRQWAEIENKMTSVERILEYTDTDIESSHPTEASGWPNVNTITYENVSFSYGKGKGYVLKNINLSILEKEKVGIVGRTGSGKSTLLSLLFRLYSYEGTVTIGGTNIKNIPLKTLRSNISIISQDPVLFSGTIRTNLDPKNEHTDTDIWNAIEILQMKHMIQSLDANISESGSNFSVGQKQLLCLVRCLLGKNKIIILDEATSDVDQDSEKLISKILAESFKNCVVLIVAHRLKTVLDCDRIVVIREGQIVECDKIEVLKGDKNSIFYSMLKHSELI